MGVAGHGTLCLLRCGNALSEIKTGVTSPVPKENMYVNAPTMATRRYKLFCSEIKCEDDFLLSIPSFNLNKNKFNLNASFNRSIHLPQRTLLSQLQRRSVIDRSLHETPCTRAEVNELTLLSAITVRETLMIRAFADNIISNIYPR